MRGDEGAALGGGERVGVELDDLRAERKIVERPEQRTIIEEARAGAHDRPPLSLRVEGEREARSEVVAVAEDAFVLVAQSHGERQVRADSPFVLHEDAAIKIPLRGRAAEPLAEAAWHPGEKVARAREVIRAARVREFDEDRADALRVRAEFQRVRAADDCQRLL